MCFTTEQVNDDDDVLPFFVYGTLRRDQTNYHLLRGRVADEFAAYIEDYQLFSLGEVPMAIHREHCLVPTGDVLTVQGELIYPEPYRYTFIMELLDRLEGYAPDAPDDSPYWRVQQTVQLHRGGQVNAWFYQGNPRYLEPWHMPIPGGDWAAPRRVLQY
ncbi:MAG: gamma-glutamylcyclotransferase family protein [Anaerolineales bacterium]